MYLDVFITTHNNIIMRIEEGSYDQIRSIRINKGYDSASNLLLNIKPNITV